jgi:hypothetical protein
MKRILSLLLTLTLVVAFFALGQADVEAAPVSTCTTNQTVFVHYHRWDETYTDTTIWTWGYGTAGSGEGSGVVEEDEFGAIYQICVDDDADANLGLINKYSAAWGDGMTDRDGVDTDMNGTLDGNHKEIMVKEDDAFVGFTDGVKHVYVFEGSNHVMYEDDANSLPYSEDLATVAIIYYDTAESYEGWNIWTWGTGTLGTQIGDPGPYAGSGLPLQSALGVDGGEVENFRVAFIQVDPADADDSIGFIMRTDAWEKKFDGDMTIPVDTLVAGDFMTTFYISGEGVFHDTFEDFEATVNFFELQSAMALDPTSVEVVFNKDVITKEDDVITFDPATFTLADKDGNDVVISQVSFNSTSDVNDTFTLITETALTGAMSPYTVSYTVADMDPYTKEFEVDSVAPVITVLGPTATTLELGDTYSLPNYFATDEVDGGTVDIYNVKVKDGMGTVDTRNAGIYEVVIEASDRFGNMAETTITVTVTDPCDATAHLNANSNVGFISLLIGLPIAFGAFITLRRNY